MDLTANGHPLDTSSERFGELDDCTGYLNDPAALREIMQEQGHLFFRGLLAVSDVTAARREILLKYAIVGEIDARHPLDDAVAGDRGGLDQANLRAFSESVRGGHDYSRVVEADPLMGLHRDLFGEDVRCFDFRWPRFARPGEGCGFHCDGPYMARATARIHSTWIPLGRVHRHEGALIVLEDSHRNAELADGYLQMDADTDGLVWLGHDPVTVQEQFGRRWLTTDFEPGDALVFSMSTLHGALDNRSTTGRCRLTSDSRYQPAAEPADERWNGPNPVAHGYDRVFYPGLGSWNNAEFRDEWKPVDADGRLDSAALAP